MSVNKGPVGEAPACPLCGAVFTGFTASDLSDSSPKPGAVLACVECSGLAILTEAGAAREPTEDEMRELGTCDVVLEALRAIDAMRKTAAC